MPADTLELTDGFDVHAHWFGTDLAVAQEHADPRWPRLVVDSADRGRLLRGDEHFRDVRASLWDVGARLADLDAAGVRTQVISPVPVTFPYWATRPRAAAYAERTNASISAAVAAGGGRLLGLGTLPLPHVADAVRALDDLMTGPQPAVGFEVGARVGDLDLDDPRLLPVWEAAEHLGAVVLVHPADGGGGTVRRGGQPYDFGLGMLTDTALAAGALVFGGVLDRFPGLRVVLAHGCGSFAWAYPRMRLGAEVFQQADGPRLDELTGSLWADTLVIDPEHLRLLGHRFGADRVVLGTDHPFFPAITSGARSFLARAEASGALPDGGAQAVFSANGRSLVGVRQERSA
ncbi:MAG: hypothetical protein JWN84_3518 [Nocardioides sp.]|nr:hypothetical protein [Nocardioides sp.]